MGVVISLGATPTNTKLDSDGLPPVGALLTEGDPLYRWLIN